MNKIARKIIEIDEEKCTGCGICIPNCPEGALQIIDGKARLVSDLFCDGLGACIGECPEGAIRIEEREAEPYDEYKVMENIAKQGENTIKAHLDHLREHGEVKYLNEAEDYLKKNCIHIKHEEHTGHPGTMPCGCPSTMEMDLRDKGRTGSGTANLSCDSELSQWPIQLHLINPNATYLDNADLVIAADCVPFAYPNFHQQFLRNKILIIFCPKLDAGIDEYISKLTSIFTNKKIKSIAIVHMEVPCCFGVERIVQSAMENAGKKIHITDYTISIKGDII
jgi:ferredoxin